MKKVLGLSAIVTGYALWLLMQSPSDEGPWKIEHAVTPSFELNGRWLDIRNVRDFRYDDRLEDYSVHYFDRRYSLDSLERIWFGLSHFGPYGLAHSFLSFEFDDGEYLSLSVEARLPPGQVYKPLQALLFRYTKIYVLATEQDVIGLRSHYRGERVLLYPIVSENKAGMEEFVLALLGDMNKLHNQPAFYSLILDNCLTNLLKRAGDLSEIGASDFRVLLPGHTDRLTYALGITPDDITFEDARVRATVNPSVVDLEDKDFSRRIRCGWHSYSGVSVPICD